MFKGGKISGGTVVFKILGLDMRIRRLGNETEILPDKINS